jgi:cell division protein FtsW
MELSKKSSSDFLLRLATIALLGFGFVMVASSSSPYASYHMNDSWFFVIRQAGWIIIGLIAMFMVSKMKPERLEKLTNVLYWAIIAMLIMVLIFGSEVNGAKSWFGFGSIGIQPTEFAKIVIIMGLAKIIVRRKELMDDFRKGMLPALILSGAIIFLILLQPDFGSTMIITGAVTIMLFVGGVNLRHLGGLVAIGVLMLSIYTLYLIGEDSYKIDRYSAFIDPWADMEGTGFQLVQSLFAFGHGGMTGVGYGESIQKLPMYLPMAYNDFIFPIIGEEFGFIGVLLFFVLFLGFLFRSLMISLKANNMFFMLTGIGLVSMLALQAIVNIGGVTGSMPMTGVTLPFISYGGSSILATLISVGILLNISRQVASQKNKTEST